MNRIKLSLFSLVALASTSLLSADLKYSVVPNFFEETPGGERLGPSHGGLVIDKSGQFYASTDSIRGIIVFGPDGKFRRAFGPMRIHGLELREENGVEYIYGARASDSQVVKLRTSGETEWTLDFPKESGLYKDPKGFRPCAVTVGPNGELFVADGYGSNFVLKFDKDRKFLKAFGGPGDEEGKFKTCHGIALDTRFDKPRLLVCNRNSNRVEHWDLDGNFMKVIQKDLRMPAAVHIQGNYAIFPELQGRVTVIDKSGAIVAQVADNPNEKHRANYGLAIPDWKEGISNSPHGASMDKNGNLFVSEWSQFGRLHKFALKH